MATKKATTGIINSPGAKAKPPRPMPSSKGFQWPERRGVAPDHRRAFAVFLRKAMEKSGDTHITLAKTFWGVTAVGGTNGQQVARWLRMEMLPSRGVAEHIAVYFKVSLEQMLADKDEYSDPSHLIVSKLGKPVGATPAPKARAAALSTAVTVTAAPTKRPYNKRKPPTNGHDVQVIDPRWTVPAGVPAPRILLELAPDAPPGMAKLQVDGYFPIDIGMAMVTMGADHKLASPREVTATTVHPPLVEHKPSLPPE